MAIKSGSSAYDSVDTSFESLAKPFHTSHPTLGHDSFFSTTEAGGGARVAHSALPQFKSGSESPTLGHDALKSSFYMHSDEGKAIPKSDHPNTTPDQFKNIGKTFKAPVSEVVESEHEVLGHPKIYHKPAEDSHGPTGKRFTERLHERNNDGKFEPSGRPTKQTRRRKE